MLMRGVFGRACLGLVLFSIGSSGFAAFKLSQIRDLDKAGQSQAAYELALEHRDQWEGHPPFDYLYGIAAINSGHYGEGVFALERVVAVEPRNDFARVELARGYLLRHEYAAARQEYESVLRHNKKKDPIARSQNALHIIDRRQQRFYRGGRSYVDVGGGYDSNIASATADQSVLVGGVLVPLEDASTEQEDMFGYVGAGTWTAGQIAHGVSWYGRLNGHLRMNLDEKFDIGALNGQAGVQMRNGLNYYQFGALGQKFYLDSEDNRNLAGLNAQWRREVSYRTDLLAYAQSMDLEYPGQDFRDSNLSTVGIGFKRLLAHRFKPVLNATVYGLWEDADEKEGEFIAERDSVGVFVSLQMVLKPNLDLTTVLRYQNDEYGAPDPTFGETRDDDYAAIELGARWTLKNNWSVLADLSYTENDSNISINEYTRTRFMTRARYDFR